MTEFIMTADVAKRVLAVVDEGLVGEMGVPVPGKMCVEAAVCYALGLPHSDDPGCVAVSVRQLKIALNDRKWGSNAARAKGLRRLAIAQLGSKDVIDDKEFTKRVAEMTIRTVVPVALRAAAKRLPKHTDALEEAAVRCEKEGTREAALAARNTAAAAAASASDAYVAAADAAAEAAAEAADAYADAYAADAYADAYAAYADAAAEVAAEATAAAAEATAAAADAADAYAVSARDRILSILAESVVTILRDMGSPGCAYLYLTGEG